MTDTAAATKLAQQLENVSGSALEWLRQVLALPIDPELPALMRAQSSAAMTALNTQLRADALRLRAQRDDKALKRLIDLIERKRHSVPHSGTESVSQPLHSLEHKSLDG